MPPLPESQLLGACQVLFGAGIKLDREFLAYVQPSGAKAAYRRRAKEIHPDLLQTGSHETRQRRAELFRELVEAHSLLNEFFRQRDTGQWPVRPQRSSHPAGRPASRPAPASATAGSTVRYYRGNVPDIHLTIGRYCYYRGLIPYHALIEALAWQRRQRPLIGELAKRWGWLSDDAVRRVTGQRNSNAPFGERAVALGLLAPEQVQALLLFQRSHQQRLGAYFVEHGYLTPAAIEQLVLDLHSHNARLARQRRNGR